MHFTAFDGGGILGFAEGIAEFPEFAGFPEEDQRSIIPILSTRNRSNQEVAKDRLS